MGASFWVSRLKFKGGQTIDLVKNSIVIFVGPNNGGKSTALREISKGNKLPSQHKYIFDKISFTSSGTKNEVEKMLRNRQLGDSYSFPDNIQMSRFGLLNKWEEATTQGWDNHVGILPFFVKEFDTKDRLLLVEPAPNIDLHERPHQNPIHIIKADTRKEEVFSRYFRKAFGEDVIVNHAAGEIIPLHVGTKPTITNGEDRVSGTYQQKLRRLPYLHDQGDGMKSFAGVFLSLYSEEYTVNIIDEPEAFLHPPQALLLGQMMGKELNKDKQLFIGTHSEHLLKGLLDVASERITMVRIERDKADNKINILNNVELQDISRDSLLRHSNVLDGLFHKRVVLVESDSDSRFYNTLSTTLSESKNGQSLDLLFIQSGGKHRFPVVVRALKKLAVPIIAIGDFDFYHEENPAREVFEELGGNWGVIQSDFMKVKRAIDEKRPGLNPLQLKQEIDGIFLQISDNIMPDSKIKEIKNALKRSSPWSEAKASGKSHLPNGEASKAFGRVQQAFEEKGLFVLEIGEIESFDKTVGGHGPRWVNEVLEKDILRCPELNEARIWVDRVILAENDFSSKIACGR
ncbi:AAA family ATPase [Chitinophaga ginsengisoli]|uniref:Putative ATP-dependent endonuclease of OLD family n=1 Tax=Chitinophaga ginsengisoli TaxID=363837 RepID=A0A2P8FXT0_9BACT|nr:AAA family ATPase [Chitinophaga ginsengisoli]PSL26455.1 putative ATP-dependent endonuclease of OLD family [Chitinophaga ginsengisoli]